MNTLIHTRLLLAPLVLSVLFAGCDATGTDGEQPSLSLSFAVKQATQSTQKKNDHVAISEAKMLIREIEFKNDLEDDDIPDDSLDFSTDPLVVVLNLDGSLNEVAVSDAEPGSYDEIRFDVHKPEDNETPPDPEFKTGDSGNERFSVIIRGTCDGQEFVYRSNENMKQELELTTPLVIDGDTGNLNVTLTVDLSQWFTDEDGNPINPANPDNENAIDESIKRSFEGAFEDNDQDGEQD